MTATSVLLSPRSELGSIEGAIATAEGSGIQSSERQTLSQRIQVILRTVMKSELEEAEEIETQAMSLMTRLASIQDSAMPVASPLPLEELAAIKEECARGLTEERKSALYARVQEIGASAIRRGGSQKEEVSRQAGSLLRALAPTVSDADTAELDAVLAAMEIDEAEGYEGDCESE